MNLKQKTIIWFSTIFAIVFLLSGCGGETKNEFSGSNEDKVDKVDNVEEINKNEISNDPVTLRIWNSNNMNDEEFNNFFINPIQKKYPFMTIESVPNKDGTRFAELIATGDLPDITLGSGPALVTQLIDADVPADLTEFIKKHNYPLDRFAPAVIPTLNGLFGSNGTSLALPAGHMNFSVLYYNKDIFEKFGVDHPVDGMTWDEAYALSRRVTKEDGGVMYRGFDFQDDVYIQYNQLSLSVIDGKSNQSIVSSDGWKAWFDSFSRFYEIPGGLNTEVISGIGLKINEFTKDKKLAMLGVAPILPTVKAAEAESGFNWDIVTLPDFKEIKGRSLQAIIPYMVVTKTSKYKEQAFLAITAFLEDEALIERAKNNNLTVAKDPAINKHFGENDSGLKGKNLKAIMEYNTADPQTYFTKYDAQAVNTLTNAFRQVIQNNKDTNTALREAEDAINKKIAEIDAASK